MKRSLILLSIIILAIVMVRFYRPLPSSYLPPISMEQATPIKPGEQTTVVKLRTTSFTQLPNWGKANFQRSFETFKKSCRLVLKRSPEAPIGSQQISLRAQDWYPVCQAAIAEEALTPKQARAFFERWFKPIEFSQTSQTVNGLFTGYYQPLLHGSLVKTSEYHVPLYGLPTDMATINPGDFPEGMIKRPLTVRIEKGKVLPYYTRAEIVHGALHGKAPILVWVDNEVERMYLEIQGSGIVELPNGEHMYVGYAGENGATYTAIGKVLIEQGVLTRDNASMQRIRAYLESHPDQMESVLNQNKSFVFFRILPDTGAIGAQGIALTPGYSMAVDRRWIPLGAPLWLSTTRPDEKTGKPHRFNRLMIAQDTGGAIRGVVRGDVFWGAGERATNIAGMMKNHGHYWLLLPKEQIAHLPNQFVVKTG